MDDPRIIITKVDEPIKEFEERHPLQWPEQKNRDPIKDVFGYVLFAALMLSIITPTISSVVSINAYHYFFTLCFSVAFYYYRISTKKNNPEQDNVSLLQMYYEDKTRWGLTFQIYAAAVRLKMMRQTLDRVWNSVPQEERISTIIILLTERCLKTDGLFMDNLAHSHEISPLEYFTYNIFCNEWKQQFMLSNCQFFNIFLQCPISISWERQQTRGRASEKYYPYKYHDKLLQEHTKAYEKMKETEPLYVFNLDSSYDIDKSTGNDQFRQQVRELSDHIVSAFVEWIKIKQN